MINDKINKSFKILYFFLKGFDVDSTLFRLNHTYSYRDLFISFRRGKLDFYLHGKKISSSCSTSQVFSIFQTKILLKHHHKLIFRLIEYDFPRSTCPLFFMNTTFYVLEIRFMINTFYKTNVLNFETLNRNSTTARGTLEKLWVEKIEKIRVDSSLLNELLFENVRSIHLYGEIGSIESNVFKLLKNLIKLEFDVSFFKQLIHQRNGIQWMRSINEDLNVNVSNATQVDFYIERIFMIGLSRKELIKKNRRLIYSFPDEDFCLWHDGYPLDRMFVTYLNEELYTFQELTCTFVWLERDLLSVYLKNEKFRKKINSKRNLYMEELADFSENLEFIKNR